MTAVDVKVDREFASLCPAPTAEESALLEESLSSEGCRDPLVVWANHGNILVDGHRRRALCKKLGIPFKIKALAFVDRAAVREWIITNQLARRNLTEEQRAYLRGKRYEGEKKKHGGDRKSQESSGQNVHPKTAQKLAAEYGVDEKTVRRDAAFAQAVDQIGDSAGPEAKAAILSGQSGATKKEVIALAAAPPATQKAAILDGDVAARKEAVKPDWAKGPSPKEEAKNDPAYRWCKALHDLQVFMVSTREHGGIAALAASWTAEARNDYAEELRRVAGELDTWISLLETVA